MVAKCANPSCSRQFHELSQGRLFVLPPFNGTLSSAYRPVKSLPECFFCKGGDFPLSMALRHCLACKGLARLSNLGSTCWTIEIH